MALSVMLRTLLILTLLLAWSVPSNAQARKELRVGVPGVPGSVDPATALEGATPLIARQVFDTLVAYRDGSTDVEPALATRWTVSRDGLTWSFTLRDGVRFHDSAPLTAAEAAASFGRLLQATPPSPVWTALFRGTPGVVKDVRAADARTVQFVLSQPYAPLLTVLAHPGLGITRTSSPVEGATRMVGTGPYRVVDASSGRIAIEAVGAHWSGPARTERIVFLDVVTEGNAEAEFDARGLDVWFPTVPPRRSEWALSTVGTHVGYLAFQTEKEPFSRKKLRRAVAAALDPAIIGVALDRAAVPLPSFLPTGMWGRREGSPIIGGTRESVKNLLAEGGWPKGFKPTLVVTEMTGPLDSRRLAETLQLMLGAADIPVQVRLESADIARTAMQAGEHEIALAETSVTAGDPHLFLYPLSASEGAIKGPRALNLAFYRNPRLDDVLVRASQLSFRPERAKLYQRAQAILADELPWIPLYVRLVWGVARPEVRNLRLHPTGFHRLSSVTFDGGFGLMP